MENKKHYDDIIIGFGKGGKTMASELANAGRTVALVEKSPKMYGGTCINVGCIPTKSLVHSGEIAAVNCQDKRRSYRSAIERKAELVERLRNKNYHKLEDNPNISVIDGTASFVSPHEVAVDGKEDTLYLEGERFYINTGSSPFVPPIQGLQDNPYVYVSEGLLELEELPKRLVIIGGGYIGVEFASIYGAFGTQVTIVQDGDVFLPREDAEIADAVLKTLEKRNIQVLKNAAVKEVRQTEGYAEVLLEMKTSGESKELLADAVLVATGRRPNTQGLHLEKAGVEVDKRGGIITDKTRTTTVPHIFAMGDVVGGLQFTYVSLDDFRIVRSKVLGDGSYNLNERGAVPYSVFLDPPFSRVGMSEREAKAAGYEVKIAKLSAAAIPKAQVLGKTDGLLKAVIDEKTGKILGAHLFCAESHELINLVKLAIDSGLHYTVLRDMIFTHPTMGEALNDLFRI